MFRERSGQWPCVIDIYHILKCHIVFCSMCPSDAYLYEPYIIPTFLSEKNKVQSVFDRKLARCDFGTARLIFYPESWRRIVLLCDFHRFAASMLHHLSARVNI